MSLISLRVTRRRPVRCTGLTEHDKYIKHGRDQAWLRWGRRKALLTEYLIDCILLIKALHQKII
jgi:hypothetical protein